LEFENMMNGFWLNFAGSMFRHGITTVSGGVVANGLATGDEVQAIGGGLAALVGLVMSWSEKKKRS
jgi:hypothetical protein